MDGTADAEMTDLDYTLQTGWTPTKDGTDVSTGNTVTIDAGQSYVDVTLIVIDDDDAGADGNRHH